jgi:hypothetical protein
MKILIIILLAIALPIKGQVDQQQQQTNQQDQAADEALLGLYSLFRAPEPKRYVADVKVKELTQVHFPGMTMLRQTPNGKFGMTYSLFNRETKQQVLLSTAVYADVKEAEDMALEYLNTVSGVLKPGSPSGPVIGTHSWFHVATDRGGVIVFVYRNTLFKLFSPDYTQTEKRAIQILKDLKAGHNCIRLRE